MFVVLVERVLYMFYISEVWGSVTPLEAPPAGESDSVRSCVRAGEAKLRERVRASVSLLAGLANRISLAVSGRVPFVPASVLFFCEV